MDTDTADVDKTLDELDRLVVNALQLDGRAEASQIAGVLGVSARTVVRRLARMQGTGTVRVVRFPALWEQPVGALLLRVKVAGGAADVVARALAGREDIPFVDVMVGGGEVGAVAVGGASVRDRLLFRQLPGVRGVASVDAYAVLKLFADAADWHLGLLDGRPGRGGGGPVELDAVDRALLARLEGDARMSCAELGRALGAPESTVRRRMARLGEAGLLRTHVVVDPRLVGMSVDANLWIDVPPGRLAEVGAALAREPHVHAVAATSGPTGLAVALFAQDLEGLYRFTVEVLGPLGVGRVESTLTARAVKRAGVVLGTPARRAAHNSGNGSRLAT